MTQKKATAIYLAIAGVSMLSAANTLAQCVVMPSENTSGGTDALSSITTGIQNTAFGYHSQKFADIGFRNTSVGAQSLTNSSGITAEYNTAVGYGSMFANTEGYNSAAIGAFTLYSNTTGWRNVAAGWSSLRSNTIGTNNTGLGYSALFNNQTGNNNTAIGSDSLQMNETGQRNAAVGTLALFENVEGSDNVAAGYRALWKNKASRNTVIGAYASSISTTGFQNAVFGNSAMYYNISGSWNMAFGGSALYNNTAGNANIGLGFQAGYGNQTGSDNIFIGRQAGLNETTSNNLYIASNPTTPLLYGKMSATPADNKLGIGRDTVPAGDAISVWNGAHLTTGGVWTDASSRELKDNIESLSTADATAALEALSAVRYVYKNSREEEYVGFIAEDVPALVATNDRRSLSAMDIVAVLTTVTKDQKAKMHEQAGKMKEKDAEIAELKDRMLQMEMAIAEVLRQETNEVRVSALN